MNCDKCQELLSDFLDGVMNGDDQATFNSHLEECFPCFNVHAEMNSIVSFCRENRGEYPAPPNEQAMWVRIRNTVEIESNAAANAAAQNPTPAARRESWWSRMMERSWELSLPQVAAAVVAIIVIASLATVFGLRGFQKTGTENSIALTGTSNRGGVALAGDMKNADLNGRLRQQQQQIKYWSQIVEERKVNWNPQVRADFEQNLNLLDETVEESLQKLSARPSEHDEVTEEMLNSALNDKMQLLKEFSDL
ncbi:MAG: zf-HC2 domain-containing protein [Acidobacteria bacterium]|nr:zf-HC2 domain-containing protein [Acidobacteriota bacterium]